MMMIKKKTDDELMQDYLNGYGDINLLIQASDNLEKRLEKYEEMKKAFYDKYDISYNIYLASLRIKTNQSRFIKRDLNGNIVKIYNSSKEMKENEDLNYATIYHYCRAGKPIRGYIWERQVIYKE